MTEQCTDLRGIGVGSGTLDLFPPRGEVGPNHEPGTKPGWAPTDETLLLKLFNDSRVERHTGGNIINVLAFLACQNACQELSFFGVLGDEDNLPSQAISQSLETFQIINLAKRIAGYQPSISIVETLAAPGSDRMVRGRPRDDVVLDREEIQDALRDKDLVVVSSLKKAHVVQQIFSALSENAIVSYNPGSSELSADPGLLRRMLQERKPYLLALNDAELRVLMEHNDYDLHELALKAANDLCTFLLCTKGKADMLLVNNGDIVEGKSLDINPAHIIDTLGAGDRAHAAALFELLRGSQPEVVLEAVARETGEVIQHVGGHGDLYRRVGSTAIALSNNRRAFFSNEPCESSSYSKLSIKTPREATGGLSGLDPISLKFIN